MFMPEPNPGEHIRLILAPPVTIAELFFAERFVCLSAEGRLPVRAGFVECVRLNRAYRKLWNRVPRIYDRKRKERIVEKSC
jgi:hypothetical protein